MTKIVVARTADWRSLNVEMLEKDIENLIAKFPKEFFPKEDFELIGQQFVVDGRRIDVLFKDKFGRKIVVEVKRGILSREASGQVMEYYGLLKGRNPDDICELILCANVIPSERKLFFENAGIECKEVGVAFITNLAKRVGYSFMDSEEKLSNQVPLINSSTKMASNKTSVWIFQANPDKYDILNALADEKIGNSIHWLVNQYKTQIKPGDIGLLWMSGGDAGVYAVTRITSAPQIMEEFSEEKKYWLGDEEKGAGKRMRVSMSVVRRLTNSPIFRSKIKSTPGLENLSIIKYSQGTNFPLTDSEWGIISKIIGELGVDSGN